MTNLTTWNVNSTLQLFSNHLTNQTFSGSILQISIYDQALDKDQIALAFQKQTLVKELQDITEQQPLHLVAKTKQAIVIQGRSSPLTVGGHNKSTLEYSVQVEITLLPKFGDLLAETGVIRSVGDCIPLGDGSKRAAVFYQAWLDDFFTSPRFSHSGKDLQLPLEEFEYRLVAVDVNGITVGWSESVKQQINIRHVNQAPTLIVPKEATILINQPMTAPLATMEQVELRDPDQNIDRVRVDVWTYNGVLQLQDHAELADFDSCHKRPSWHCHGKGSFGEGTRNMTFLAEPDDVSLLLSNLLYKGSQWDQEDSIVIGIFDGSGGPCLREEEHKYNSIHNACYGIFTNVSVPPISEVLFLPATSDAPPSFYVNLPWYGYLMLGAALILASCQTVQMAQACFEYLRRRKHATDNADGVFMETNKVSVAAIEEENTESALDDDNLEDIDLNDGEEYQIADVDQESLQAIW